VSLRWPYFAYEIDGVIFINPLFDPNVIVYLKTNFEDQRRIIGLNFSEDLKLYSIAEDTDNVWFY